jgi:uncharacterized protein YkwD
MPGVNPQTGSDSVGTPDVVTRTELTHLFILMNRYRAANGVAPLAISQPLARAAQWQSDDMAARGLLSHTDSLGRDSFQRMRDFKYAPRAEAQFLSQFFDWSGVGARAAVAAADFDATGYTPLAENIACGHRDASATFEQWKNSPPHNANLLNPLYRDLGLGRAASEVGGEYGCRWYWTADFGGWVE